MISGSPVRLALALLCVLLSGTQRARSEPLTSVPYLPDEAGVLRDTLFTRLGPEITRLEFSHPVLAWHPAARLYATAFACGNMALGDLDLDGFTDIFVPGGPGSSKVYLQAEHLVFVDVSAGLRISDGGLWAASAVMVDIDNDADLDIYLCCYDQPNKLYVNQLKDSGRLWFQEKAHAFGLDIQDASLVAAFADYDRDGDLDLYLLTHQLVREGGWPSKPVQLEKDETGNALRFGEELSRYYELDDPSGSTQTLSYHETGRPDYLLRNDHGKFQNVTLTSGINGSPFTGNSVIWWDADSDGYPDLYVGNDGPDPDLFYHNNGDGTFVNASGSLPRAPVDSRGTTLIDANGDAIPDLFVSDLFPETHFKRQITLSPWNEYSPARWRNAGLGPPQSSGAALFLPSPDGHIHEAAWAAGIAATGWTSAVKAGDFDQDGREDLFVLNGAVRNTKMADLPRPTREQLAGRSLWDFYRELAPEKRELNRAYRNGGDAHFRDVTHEWGLAAMGISHTCSLGDLDNDGDLDLVVGSLGEPLIVYRNDGASGNSIRVRLRGTKSNLHGVGARVYAATPAGRQVREIRCGGGFLDADETSVHFGLGTAKEVSELEVRWPSGIRQRFTHLAANRSYTVTEEPASPVAEPVPSVTWFTADRALLSFRHRPGPAAWSSQPLVPFSRNVPGPSLALGDADGDGDFDLFFGGLLLNQTTPPTGELRFEPRNQRTSELAGAASAGALFLDVDSDGDLDVYQGREEGAEGAPKSLLLVNWERGVLGLEPGHLPESREAAYAVAAADVDRDGDTDLYVGGPATAGQYPLSGPGVLYLNEHGTLRDATAELAPALAATGLVNAALWTDLNGDGWLDLVLAPEWGALTLFLNRDGHLLPAPENGLSPAAGRWAGLASADLDQDGDLDLIATNLGLNTPYQASRESPNLLFWGKFGGMEEPRLLEALLDNGVCFPRRNLSDLVPALPFLQTTWKSHREFASAPLNQVIPLAELEQATLFKATELRSGVFWNDGTANFRFAPLPAPAQRAPAFGIAIADVDLDGAEDVLVTQNLSQTRPGLGPFRGEPGLLLRNTPLARSELERFLPVPAAVSGIALAGDGRPAVFADLNGDHFPDLIAGIHGAPPAVFLHRGVARNATFAITLRGLPGNPTAIGAKVQVSAPGLPLQLREVHAGEGFLSSRHGGPLLFARPATAAEPIEVLVRWPRGTTTRQRIAAATPELVIDQPTAP